jgi:hypothetical protein
MAKMGFGEVGNPADVDMVESTLITLVVINLAMSLSAEIAVLRLAVSRRHAGQAMSRLVFTGGEIVW